MKRRIAVLALAIGFLAAPTSVAAMADSCPGCCPRPSDAPCQTGEAPCVSLVVAPCCDAAAAAPASQAKRLVDAPAFHPVAATFGVTAPVSRAVHPPGAGRDLAVLTSPLRLSVVLRI